MKRRLLLVLALCLLVSAGWGLRPTWMPPLEMGADNGPDYLQAGTSYQDAVTLHRIAGNVWLHRSYARGTDALVQTNGLVLVGSEAVLLVNTTAGNDAMRHLLALITERFALPCEGVVLTSAATACVAGAAATMEAGIPLFATESIAERLSSAYTVEMVSVSAQGVPEWGGAPLSLAMPIHLYPDAFPEATLAGEEPEALVWIPDCQLLYTRNLFQAIDGTLPEPLSAETAMAWMHRLAQWHVQLPEVARCVPGTGQWGTDELITYTAARLNERLPKEWRE